MARMAVVTRMETINSRMAVVTRMDTIISRMAVATRMDTINSRMVEVMAKILVLPSKAAVTSIMEVAVHHSMDSKMVVLPL